MSDKKNLQTINESIQALSGKVGLLSDNLTQMGKRLDNSTFMASMELLLAISLVGVGFIWFCP